MPLNIAEYEAIAREQLPRMVYDYYAGGSWDERTLEDNVRAFDHLAIFYRVLRDVAERTTATTVLGREIAAPIVIAPTAFQCMAHPDGELATARAASAFGTIMIASSLSTKPIEAIVEASTTPVWFQLYVYRDREATAALIARAEDAGATAIVLTVDAQVWCLRERDARNGFALPAGLEMSNLLADQSAMPDAEGSALGAYVAQMFDPALSWADIAWLRECTSLPIVLKGIVHPDDARLAVEHGVEGIFVSNHGGRQIDTSPAAIDALPEVVEAAGGRTEVMIDGGVRRGSDVVKAVALGARAVGVGRPILWGLAANGQAGVEDVLGMLRRDFDAVMALCGATEPAQLPSLDVV